MSTTPEPPENKINWKSITGWAAAAVAIAAITAWTLINLLGCTTIHGVTQTADGSVVYKGDTIRMKTVIEYRQKGKISKE